jgi:TPR repeat protein
MFDNSETHQSDNNYNLTFQLSNKHEELSQFIQFDKIIEKEMGPTVQNICENIFEEDLGALIDELVKSYFKRINEGKNKDVRKQYILDYINNHKINLQEICCWLLNNQNDSNFIYLLGYFNFHGIGMDVNKQNALELYQKAVELENNVAQFDLAILYMDRNDIDNNLNKTFELSTILAKKEYPGGINMRGYCYQNGIGINVNEQKAFELYQKAANLGNSCGIYNLGCCYENGMGTNVNEQKAFELYQKAAYLENTSGMNNLGRCYNIGIGTGVNKQKALKLYQKASNLGNDIAQCNLAYMYENGDGIAEDLDQAIYWYKKSAKQGYKNAQYKLEMFLEDGIIKSI